MVAEIKISTVGPVLQMPSRDSLYRRLETMRCEA